MNKDELLREYAKFHKEWIGVVKAHSFNQTESQLAEDFVQEAYIKIHKSSEPNNLVVNGTVSKGYFFFCLKSVLYNYRKTARKVQKISMEECKTCDKEGDIYPEEESYAYDIIKQIEGVEKDMGWNSKLFNIYRTEVPSIRQLSKETKISVSKVSQTIKYCKNEIHEKLEKEYKKYKSSRR